MCVRNAKDRFRMEWRGGMHEDVHRAFSWRWVSELVFFVDARNDGDVQAFASMCRTLILKITHEPDLMVTDGSRELDMQIVYRIGKILETSFDILEVKAHDQADLLMDSDGMDEQRGGLTEITELIAFFLGTTSNNSQDTVLKASSVLSYGLLRKGVFGRLAKIIGNFVRETETRSIEGSVIEGMALSILNAASTLEPTGLKAALGAFELLGLPSLRSVSPKLLTHVHTLLSHSQPFLNQLLNSKEGHVAKSLKIDLKGSKFRQLCMNVFHNLLNSDCLVSDRPSRELSGLGSGIVRFLTWTISRNLESNPQESDEMDVDEDSDIDVGFPISSDLQHCMAMLQGQQGNRFLLSLTEAIFSDDMGIDDQGRYAFCELLHFVICTIRDRGQRRGMLLLFALSGKLVEQLWHLIKSHWNVRRSAFPDDQLLDLLLAPLTILCQTYSAFLSTAGEHELRQLQGPLTLRDLYDPRNPGGGLITVLKKCLWQVAWAKPPSSSRHSRLRSIMMDDFPSACGQLLGQLYDNSIRWELAPADHFHVQTSHLARFVAEATSDAIQFAKDNTDSQMEQHRTSVILAYAPCLIPFHDRARIFQAHIRSDRALNHTSPHLEIASSLNARIRRDHLLEDGFEAFKGLTQAALRRRLRVEFVDKHGMLEAGVDGGGLFKDFLEELVKQGFDPEYGFFAQTEQRELYANPSAEIMQPEAREIIAFLGRMLGKAVYDGILVELPLAHFFLKKFQNQLCDLHDLPSLDPDVYSNLIKLRSQDNVADMELHFTITDNISGGNEEVELKPNGKQIRVTRDNVIEYIHRFADYRLNKEVHVVSSAFLQGFFDVIDAEWVSMFNANELRMLISGSVQRLDMENLRKNVNYTGGYNDQHPVILNLWDVLNEFSTEEQRLFLKFVTGCSRAPLLGFEQLHPKICIQMAGNEDNSTVERLPTSATCANLLKLPPYGSKEVMHQKLLYAVSDKSGFYLS